MKKKILIVTDNLPEQINGVVTTYQNIEACAIRDGYDVAYIHPGRYRHFDCPRYSEVKLSVATPKMVGQEIEKISPDYIHLATEGPLGLSARRYLTVHGYRYNTAYHTKFPEGMKKILGIPESVTWPLIRWFHHHSGIVLTTTPSMVNELKHQGFDPRKLVSWTRGVDRNTFHPEFRTGTPGVKYLVCVSRVSKEKNLEDFFNLDIGKPVHKIMVGDGPMLEEYREQYPDVEFVGFKRGKELARFYQLADVFVFPSRWDTFGIVMIEAMACGTPVAAYPVTGPIDVIEQGVTGIMDDDLAEATKRCLHLDRDSVLLGSRIWTWEAAWDIFKSHLRTAKE